MQLEDMILISVDDHVVEPANMWEGRVPKKYLDRVPRIVSQENGTDAWEYLGKRSANAGLNAVAGRPPADYGLDAQAFADMRPGCYDVHERVRDMSANGVLASLNFPSWAGFAAAQFLKTPDKDLALALLRAYNDWHIEGWCGEYPDRFIPLALVPVWDPQLMAEEVHRLAHKGCQAVTFAENPAPLGLPSLHSDHWDPFWAACEDEQTVVCMHIGSSSQIAMTAEDAPFGVSHSYGATRTMGAALDLVFSPIFRKFPTFKVALSEGGSDGSLTCSTRWTSTTPTTGLGRARTLGTSCRARCSGSASSPVLSRTPQASSCATRSASTRSRGSATTRTPTRPGPRRPSSSGRSWGTSRRRTSTRSPGRTPCGYSTSTRSRSGRVRSAR